MMKSFFKKLAFVMALAMVVSMAAPAGAAYAAEVGLSIQGEKTARETFYIEVDDTVDLGYVGYEGWTKDTVTNWVSSDETVASVDGKGNVTGLDNGETTITLTVDGTWVQTAKVIVGTGKAEAETPTTNGEFDVVMVSDNSVRIYTDLELKADELLFWYYEEGQKVEVPLVESVKTEEGSFLVKMYDGVLFEDGVTYGFGYDEAFDEFECEIGDIARVELTVGGKVQTTVELNNEDDSNEFGYELGVIMYDGNGVNITTTAQENGAYPVFTIEEDTAEDERYTVTEVGDEGTGIWFSEPCTAVVKVSCEMEDEELDDPVVLLEPQLFWIQGVTPEAYKIALDVNPVFTIVKNDKVEDVDFTKTLNTKLAVGDDEYTLVLKLKDNKGKTVVTNNSYLTDLGVIDDEADFEKGKFSFKSANIGRLYVTDEGELMPNAAGKTSVLVYFTPAVEDDDEEETKVKPVLVAVVPITVSPLRKVGTVTAEVDNALLSTRDINDANKTKIVVEVRDTLGDKVGVEGVEVTIEPTIKDSDLKKANNYPAIDKTSAKVVKGKVEFTVTATEGVMKAENAKQEFKYAVKVGNVTKEVKLTVKSINLDDKKVDVIEEVGLIFGNAKEIKEDNTGIAHIELPVTLAGISNDVAASLIPIAGPKVAADKAVAGNYYFTVKKGGEDITEKTSVKVREGVLYIDITTKKDITYSEFTGSETKDAAYVDLVHGAGTYTVAVFKFNGTKYYSTGNYHVEEKYTVTNKLPSIDTDVTKVRPTYAETTNIAEVVKNCFKFRIGTQEFTGNPDTIDTEYANYHISVDANTVANGEVVFINSVTFYKNSAVDGAWINCGTVEVNDYITFADDEE